MENELVYNIGDILEFESAGEICKGIAFFPGPVRAIVLDVDKVVLEPVALRLLVFVKELGLYYSDCLLVMQKNIVSHAKLVGHADISSLIFQDKTD